MLSDRVHQAATLVGRTGEAGTAFSGRRRRVGAFGQARAIAATLTHISRDELWRRMEAGDGLVVVDALAPMSFAHSHLPGAINLPPDWVDERGPSRIPDRNAEIVVYCSSSRCDSSGQVAQRLLELGYPNVRHYVEGKRDWVEAGLPLARGGR
jgi:rhodanese-related sulfurtransferase